MSIDFVTSLLILKDLKRDKKILKFVIVDRLTKMIYYKLFKIILDIIWIAEIIMDVIVRQYDFLDSIISNWGTLFILKFWLSFNYL